ncbi:hypothetical protein BGX26_003483 [Mortierella sp. AD094]|nr:hypothetical protein BGX26_003483 [Mortierella sp. AD094]
MIARTFVLTVAVALSAVTLSAQGAAIALPANQQQDIVQRDIPLASAAIQEQAQAIGLMRRGDEKNVAVESVTPGSIKPVVKAACKDDDDDEDEDDDDDEDDEEEDDEDDEEEDDDNGNNDNHHHHGDGRDNHGYNVETGTYTGPTMTATGAYPTMTMSPSSGSAVKTTRGGAAVGLVAVILAAYMI